MPATALQQLIDLQRSLYDRALSEARENSGAESAAIGKYQQEFEASLPTAFQSVTERKLLSAMDRSQIVLFGDFHSHKQNQRAFLRILSAYQHRPDHAPVVVYLEMFKSKDQAHLDAWQAGKLTDEELQEEIKYDQTWGFPWNNYRPILAYCRHHQIPLVGINTSKGGKDSLEKRDAHAADIIHKFGKGQDGVKSLCLIGEFHLADRHLPNALTTHKSSKNTTAPLRIFANLDKCFFAKSTTTFHQQEEYLALNQSTYCVINSPPWMKWHSYSLCEEIRRVGRIPYLETSVGNGPIEQEIDLWADDDERLYASESLDLDQQLRDLQQQIVTFLKIKVQSDIFDRFNVVHGGLDDQLAHMPKQDISAFLVRASTDGFAVDFSGRLVYIPVISINNMAAAAGQVLFGSLSQMSENYGDADQLFTQQCLKYTFGFVTNKLLNPRLPLYSVAQLQTYVDSCKGKKRSGLSARRRSVAEATLKLHAWISKRCVGKLKKRAAAPTLPAALLELNAQSSDDICRSLAQLISEPICRGLALGKIDTIDLQKNMLRDCKDINAAKETLAAMILLVD
jgi:hypothetical protein